MAMKVFALLCFFDEPVEDLERCILSLKGVATHLVALDGAYKRFRHSDPASPQEQHDAIERAAEKAGLELIGLKRPKKPFKNQAKKRTRLFEIAEEHGRAFSDWVLIIDADEYVSDVDKKAFKRGLENTRSHTVRIGFIEDFKSGLSEKELALQKSNIKKRAMAFRIEGIPRVFRLLPNMRVEDGSHWVYTADDSKGNRCVLKGSVRVPDLRSYLPATMKSELVLTHRTTHRPMKRKIDKAEHYEERKKHGEDL